MGSDKNATICVIDGGSGKVPDILAMVDEMGAKAVHVLLQAANGYDFSQCDGVIMSGGPHLYTDPGGEQLVAQFAFVDMLTVPTLGICLGHQALGARHGVMVYRGEEYRRPMTIRFVREHPLLKGISAETTMVESHCEGIPLPAEFELLATSDAYPVEAMVHRSLPLFGVQFHPESSGAPGRKLIANFVNIVRQQMA
jgi:GMP synthase-like glutamine amidotransferase